MADEVTLSATLAYAKGNLSDSLSVLLAVFSPAGVGYTKVSQSVGTSQEVIILGDVAAPGYAMFVNRDPTNYIELKTATGGIVFAKLDPDTDSDGKGGVCLLKLGSGAQAPFAIANSGACIMDVFIIPT